MDSERRNLILPSSQKSILLIIIPKSGQTCPALCNIDLATLGGVSKLDDVLTG